MPSFFFLTKRRIFNFFVIAFMWNVIQWWLFKSSYVFYQLDLNEGNAPSYIRFSLDVMAGCLGNSIVYPPGQAWFRFPYGWVYIVILLFWGFVWYTLACLIDKSERSRRKT